MQSIQSTRVVVEANLGIGGEAFVKVNLFFLALSLIVLILFFRINDLSLSSLLLFTSQVSFGRFASL